MRTFSNIVAVYILCILIKIGTIESNDGYTASHESDEMVREQENTRHEILSRRKMTKTTLLEGYELVVRSSATPIFRFTSYRTVSVLVYPMPHDVSDAVFVFQAEVLHMNSIGSCEPTEVFVHLQQGSFPVTNPDGYPFPGEFINVQMRDIYTLQMLADASNNTLQVPNPLPGYWYAIAFIKWEDPKDQKVEQQGLFATCQTVLYSDLQVKKQNVQLTDCYNTIFVSYDSSQSIFKCVTIDTNGTLDLEFLFTEVPVEPLQVLIQINAKSIPGDLDNILQCYSGLRPGSTKIQLTFLPHPEHWHYIKITKLRDGSINALVECESYMTGYDIEEAANNTIVPFLRDAKGIFFTFDYQLPNSNFADDPVSVFNISSMEVKSFSFDIMPVVDIGGSLTIAVTFMMDMKYFAQYKRHVVEDSLVEFTTKEQFKRLVVCLTKDHAATPINGGFCKYNDLVKPPLFVLNTTDSYSIDDMVIIPFPESGRWYLSFRLFCDATVCPCRTAPGDKYYVERDPMKFESYVLDNLPRDDSYYGSTECVSTLMATVSSMPCINGRCSGHGNCLFTTSGGMVMSSCACDTGYGGWDCSDDSRMDSYGRMMLSVLFLTLSNLLFFFSIYVASIRAYYTEALMYTLTMISSTFYHACDAPIQVALCIAPRAVLQFADFLCGLMSFWVTLLAMSIIPNILYAMLLLAGGVVISILTTWNKQSLIAFMAPVSFGVLIFLSSWYSDYRRNRKFRFAKIYYCVYLPTGIVLVSVGLICYAFLQTEQNYLYVHSLWHMIIALSVVCLLPDSKRKDKVNAFLPSKGSIRWPLKRFFRRSESVFSPDEAPTS